MNKYTLLIILTFFSCESLFHEDNKYIILDTQQEKVDLINGIYSRLAEVHNSEYFSVLCRSDDINLYYGYYYDGCSLNANSKVDSVSINPISVINNIYLNLYTAIISANSLINRALEKEDALLLGEVYFLRAYCFFKLARLFGTPPLVVDNEVNYLLEKPEYSDLYELIESDMLMALELLPETYTDSRIPGETPHKGTAKSMLAEIYLSMAGFPVNDEAKYVEAARLSGEVIEQADYYNFSLLYDIADLWKEKNRHNTENIFSLFFNTENDNTGNTIGGIKFISDWQQYNDITLFDSKYKPEFRFFNFFPNNYRKCTSLITGSYMEHTYEEPNSSILALVFRKYNPLENPCHYLNGVFSLKWLDLSTRNMNDLSYWDFHASEITLYLLRYAQTLLTYAESKARIGELDASAYEAVNKVRRRANKLDINTVSEFDLPQNLSSEQFLDSVVWERAWELCSEPDGRWFDIIRLDLKDKLVEYRYSMDVINTISNDLLTSDWYFYQIPQQDRWLNPNFK